MLMSMNRVYLCGSFKIPCRKGLWDCPNQTGRLSYRSSSNTSEIWKSMTPFKCAFKKMYGNLVKLAWFLANSAIV